MDLMDCSLPGSPVHGILQARMLKWIAIPFCRESTWPRDGSWISCITGRFFSTEPQGSPMNMEKVRVERCNMIESSAQRWGRGLHRLRCPLRSGEFEPYTGLPRWGLIQEDESSWLVWKPMGLIRKMRET